MEGLNYEIQDFIETSLDPLKNEYNFIKKSDWTKAVNDKAKEREYNILHLITQRALKTAKDLNAIAKNDLAHPAVKEVMDLCKSVYDIYEKYYSEYTKAQKWENFLDEGKDLTAMELEMRFQNDLRDQLNTHKRNVRSINFGDIEDRVEVRTFNDTPLPLFMRDLVEEKFPEVKELLDKQKSEKDVIPKATSNSKKGNKLPKK